MQSTSENAAENPQPREGLIDTAVRFLGNPNIIDRPLQQKQTFLKSKGLTDDEIQIAIGRANLSAVAHQQAMVVPGYPIPQHTATPQQLSIWRRITDILHTVALLGGFGYVVFWVYKSYIEPFLFGHPKPKKSTAESLSSIEEAITNVSRCTTELKAEIHSELSRISQERESGAVRNLADIKSDIATVKGLLLSRQQFPSAPTANLFRNSQGSKPMIPAWQMSSEQNSCLKGDDNQAKTLSSSQSEKSQDEFVSCNDQELESDKGKDSSTSTVPMKLDSQSNGSVNTSVESLS